MKCPKCGSNTKVVDVVVGTSSTHRKRECLECGAKFVTKETLTDESMPRRWKEYGYDKERSRRYHDGKR